MGLSDSEISAIIASKMGTGSHQAQHIIPQSMRDNGAVKVADYLLDYGDNGIFAVNKGNNSTVIDQICKKYNISKSAMDRYITETTHHGIEYVTSFNHGAYNEVVEQRLIELCKAYGLPYKITTDAELEAAKKALSPKQLELLRKDLINLEEALRKIHIEGMDLYLKNNFNTGEKNWLNKVEGYDPNATYTEKQYKKFKEEAMDIYEKELNKRLDEKFAKITKCKKGAVFGV